MKNLNGFTHEIEGPFGLNEDFKYSHLKTDLDLNTTKKSSFDHTTELFKPMDKKEILKQVQSFTLSNDVKYFVDEYEKIFSERSRFEWKWLGTVFRDAGVTLSSIDEKYLDSITDCKILFCLLYIILDDVAEVHKDEDQLKEMLEIFNNNSVKKYNKKIILLKELWQFLQNKLAQFPRYEEFKDVFMYDFKQVLNSAEYSILINKNPELINSTEIDIYDSHGMVVFLINGIDLMVSPDFDKSELAKLRSIFWHSQQMARIGNSLGTWKREIKEKDSSSGVMSYALTKNIVTLDEIENLDEIQLKEKIENSDFKAYYMKKWAKDFSEIQNLKASIKSIDINQYINGLKNVLNYHIACDDLI
jgi:hypothetical protein